MDRPTVIFAMWQSGARGDGGVRSISEIVRRLRAVKPVLVTQRDSDCTQTLRASGIPVHLTSFGGGGAVGLLGDGFSAVAANLNIQRLIRRTGATVVHCNDLRAFWNAAPAGLARGCRIVLNVRSIKAPQDSYGVKWRVARSLASRTLLLSQEMQEAFDARVPPLSPSTGSNSMHIYSAVDTSRFRPAEPAEKEAHRRALGIPKTTVAVGYVGLLGPRKAQAELLQEIAESPEPAAPTHFYFIGDVEPGQEGYADYCRRLIRKHGLGDKVTLVGYRDDVEDWYRALDLTVLTSKREGLARCMLESLACAVPMVSFDVPSAEEILTQWDCGVVVAQGDYSTLLAEVERLAMRHDTRQRLSMNGLRAIRQHMAPTIVTQSYERLYLELSSDSG